MLQLANDRVIDDPLRLATAKFEWFPWDWYDGVATDPDKIEPVDFAITIAMNSRATAGRMMEFMKLAERLGDVLCEIPTDVALSETTLKAVGPAVRKLFEIACSAKGTKLAVASKVLHRKRPMLIPMLDGVVVDKHYWPALQRCPAWFEASWLVMGSWSDPTQYMGVMARELDDNREALARVRAELPASIPAAISDVRLLEAALYAKLQEEWPPAEGEL